MPIVGIRETDTYVEVNLGEGWQRYNYADIPGNSGNQRAGAAKKILQELYDVRTLKTDLPIDDPRRTVNPNQPWSFWGRADGSVHQNDNQNTYSIDRSVEVVDVVWDGTRMIVEQKQLGPV